MSELKRSKSHKQDIVMQYFYTLFDEFNDNKAICKISHLLHYNFKFYYIDDRLDHTKKYKKYKKSEYILYLVRSYFNHIQNTKDNKISLRQYSNKTIIATIYSEQLMDDIISEIKQYQWWVNTTKLVFTIKDNMIYKIREIESSKYKKGNILLFIL